jgi:TRAP-type mannitol/chloroaromatic compound transport system substrate-binding protein
VLPPEEEKNSDNSTIAAKSAMLAAASAVCPTWLRTWPASLSTGTTRPSEVADSVIAMSSGCVTQPTAVNAAPAP